MQHGKQLLKKCMRVQERNQELILEQERLLMSLQPEEILVPMRKMWSTKR
jgi:hypothetical protein